LQGVLREHCSKSRQRTPLTKRWIVPLLTRRPNDGLDEPRRPVNTQTEDEAVTRRMSSASDAKAPETNGLRLIAGRTAMTP